MRHSKKRQLEVDEEETLMLRVESKIVPKKKKRLSKYRRLRVMEGSLVKGYLQGQQCYIMLDSGSNFTTMSFSWAKSLGLITGHEVKVKVNIDLWDGIQEVEVIKLREVMITLEGGVEISTPIEVLPDDSMDY